MKKIEAVIRHHKLDSVKDALTKFGVQGMTVAEVRGTGKARSPTEVFRGLEYSVDFTPRIKIEVVVADNMVHEAIRVIADAARTGQVGDGRIFVSRLEEIVRVRTGETGVDAI